MTGDRERAIEAFKKFRGDMVVVDVFSDAGIHPNDVYPEFADVIEAAIREARREERERCAEEAWEIANERWLKADEWEGQSRRRQRDYENQGHGAARTAAAIRGVLDDDDAEDDR